MSFWEHLDALRGSVMRSTVVTLVATVAAFAFKDELFYVVLAPTHNDFITYQLIHAEPFTLRLINTQLTEQFMVHVKVAFFVGILVAAPYILYSLFSFVAPALYERERRATRHVVTSAYIMFMLGTAINYFILFPLTVRFLGTYSVSDDVANMLTLSSYIETLVMMSLLMGIVFELPVVCWLLGRIGLLTSNAMRRVRRHAIVTILIVAAIITPTGDIFTLLVVSLPIYALYEVSILITKTKRQ